MKRLFIYFLFLTPFLVACKKKSSPVAECENTSNQVKSIENKLISGSNCTSFVRYIEGVKMEDLSAAKQTSDGGYIFSGYTETIAASEKDILVIKTDCEGETEWIKTISNTYTEIGTDIIELSTGGYAVASVYSLNASNLPFSDRSTQIIKLDSSGEIIWKKEYDLGSYSQVNTLLETPNGNLLLAGFDETNGGFVFQTNSSGIEMWRRDFDNSVHLFDLAIKSNSNYVVCGSINQGADIFVAELNNSGIIQWTNSIDRNNVDNEANALTLVNDEIILSGYNRFSGSDLPGFIMKLDATGTDLWYVSLATEGYGIITDCVLSHDNKIVGVGSKSNSTNLIKLDPLNGGIIWENTSNTPLPFTPHSIELTSDNGFMVSGNRFVGISNRDGVILKTDVNGDYD